jgi:simple sugar transport system permease protein
MTTARKHIALVASLAVYVVLYAAASAYYADRNFFSLQVFLNFLRGSAVLGIMAVGETMVILSGGIDLSVGAVMSLTSILVGVLVMEAGVPPAMAIPAALALGTVLGLAMGALIHLVDIKPFIVTLAGMFFARGLGFIIHLESIAIEHPAYTRLVNLGLPLGGGYMLPLTAIVLVIVVAAGIYVSRHTSFGRNVYALGGNEEAALLMGLPVGRTKVLVYGLSGFCSALAGVVMTLDQSSGTHGAGVGMELDAIAAVVVGGTLLTGGVGSVWGTLIGVLTIGLIREVIVNYVGNLNSGMTSLAIGLLLLAFVLLQRFLTRRSAAASVV